MNKRKFFLFFLLLFVALVIGVAAPKIFKKDENTLNDIELTFGNHYISYVIENDDASFNMFAAQKVQNETSAISDMIEKILFNNKNLEVTDFQIESGSRSHDGYQLVNFIVDVKVTSDDIESADQMIIDWKSGQSKVYDIGVVALKNAKGFSQDHISPVGEYGVTYQFPGLDVQFVNEQIGTIVLHGIEDLNHTISYIFKDKPEWKAQENYRFSIPALDVKNEFDFYTVTPVFRYSVNGSEHVYAMPGVLYGIFPPDKEIVEKIIRH